MTDAQDLQFYLDRLTAHVIFPTIRGVIIAKEIHQSGVPHFHAIISFHKKKSIYRNDAFNFIFDKQVNIQTVRDLAATIKYVTKNGLFVSAGEPLALSIKPTNSVQNTKARIIEFLKAPERTIDDLKLISTKQNDNVMFHESGKLDN
jgi:hypothetical protein